MKMEPNDSPTGKEMGQLARDIRTQLTRLGVNLGGDPSLDRLPVDLADIYEVCASYQRLIDKFLDMEVDVSKWQVMELFDEVYSHLYLHLPYHHKRLPKGLKRLSTELEPDEAKRDAYADEQLQKTLERAGKLVEERRQ